MDNFYIKIENNNIGQYIVSYYHGTDLRDKDISMEIPIVRIIKWLKNNPG